MNASDKIALVIGRLVMQLETAGHEIEALRTQLNEKNSSEKKDDSAKESSLCRAL